MKYTLQILQGAARQLAALPEDAFPQVRDCIRSLGLDPLPSVSQKIDGRNGWRLASGNFRVVYEFDQSAGLVTVLDVSRRSDL